MLHKATIAKPGDQQRHDKVRKWWVEIRDLQEYLLVGVHIGKKTNAQRKRPYRVTYYFDEEDQCRNRKHQSGQFRSRKVLNMAEQAVLANTNVVIVNE